MRRESPLVQNITNFVVMNNTANALLSLGASPVMAHAVEEAADMARIASALVLNIGTLNPLWVEGMMAAAEAANEGGIPVVFDPVGVGATPYRNEVALKIIERCTPSIIRGNASEIMALVQENATTKGVDSTAESRSALDAARVLAEESKAIVVISGAEDFITDGSRILSVKNGSPLMPKVTGMGCTASAVVGAFAAVNGDYLQASAHAMAVMSIAGEIAAGISAGPGSLQTNFLDVLFHLSDEQIADTFVE